MFGFSIPYDNYSGPLVGTFLTWTRASTADASLFVFVSEFKIECEKSRAGRNVP